MFFTRLRAAISAPLPAAAIYLAVMTGLSLVLATALGTLVEQRSDVAAAAAALEQMQRRQVGDGMAAATTAHASPFLEGATVTVAGAGLVERVAGSVIQSGGKILSTQLDVPNAPARAGSVTMIASCEVDQPQLQQILYDLEAGMPLLVVDQLAVQAAVAGGRPGTEKLQVRLAVSGQWRGAK
ncbi:MAG: type II secretion system protein GspM [Alphaproteobacteria bacterium]|nr:type II secretion system protein GspM [Alphaproteobacteria bacterium]